MKESWVNAALPGSGPLVATNVGFGGPDTERQPEWVARWVFTSVWVWVEKFEAPDIEEDIIFGPLVLSCDAERLWPNSCANIRWSRVPVPYRCVIPEFWVSDWHTTPTHARPMVVPSKSFPLKR